MGQYWKAVNLDRREYIHAHALGSGLKLWEQLAHHPGVGEALVILCAAMPVVRGGGDLDLLENWHGPERTEPGEPGPSNEPYRECAKRTIGRWAGNRIALVGDYAENGDLDNSPVPASQIYHLCGEDRDGAWTDVSADVARVIEHELRGRYTGTGWRDWEPEK